MDVIGLLVVVFARSVLVVSNLRDDVGIVIIDEAVRVARKRTLIRVRVVVSRVLVERLGGVVGTGRDDVPNNPSIGEGLPSLVFVGVYRAGKLEKEVRNV